MIKKIGVLGAGQMGNGIAHVFAQYGYQVVLFDIAAVQLEKAVATIRQNLERQAKKGTIAESLITETMSRIATTAKRALVMGEFRKLLQLLEEKIDFESKI